MLRTLGGKTEGRKKWNYCVGRC